MADLGSVDRRIERLEAAVAELERKADVLETGLGHLRELVNLRFSGLESSISSQGQRIQSVDSKIDGLIVTLQGMIQDQTRLAAEVTATPAGRTLAAEILELRTGREENRKAILELQRRIWMATGALSVVVFLVNLLAPAIGKILGIPS